jgi:hypothetical protein
MVATAAMVVTEATEAMEVVAAWLPGYSLSTPRTMHSTTWSTMWQRAMLEVEGLVAVAIRVAMVAMPA